MQIDQTEIHLQLSHIVRSVTRDHELFEDLLQEAYLHLWLKLLQTPGQTQSWYLQSCRFQLLHLLNAGSSMDAVKRRHARCEVEDEQDALEQEILRAGIADPVFEQVSEKDALDQLMMRLTPIQQQILNFLHMGFGLRETARVMEISHQAVGNHRRNIADIAAEIDLFSCCGTLVPTPCEKREPSTASG
jgi:RNA polymerase sigma factor (sigma-70 family)